ncbi:MAG: hypothetical protein II776_05655 [Clostridia bacterium]|nr:hypothetical protein [Clostridia bacterium]
MKKAVMRAAILLCFLLLAPAALGAGSIDLALSDGEGRIGDTVDLALTAANNPGIISLQLTVKYDDTKLRLLSVTDGGILGREIHHQESMTSPYVLSWENYVAEENFTADGTLCTLRFQVIGGEAGEEIPVKLSAGEYGAMNFRLVDVGRTLTDGRVTVLEGKAAAVPAWPFLAGAGALCVWAVIAFRRNGKREKENKR